MKKAMLFLMLLCSTAALAQEPKSVKTERITVPPYKPEILPPPPAWRPFKKKSEWELLEWDAPENNEYVRVVPSMHYVKPLDPMIVKLVYRTEMKDGKAVPVFFKGDVVKMTTNSEK